jgi:1-acyl-sn-glycerol-3-phosphate acyltransferase
MNYIIGTLGMLSRIIVTRICFLLFGLGALILGYLIFPVVRFFTKDKIQKDLNTQYIISLTFRLFIFIIGTFGNVKFVFKNFDRLEPGSANLMIANHPTLIDYVAIVSRLKNCYTLLKADASNNPFMRMVTRNMGYISNSNPEKAYEQIGQIIANGQNMLIFPEGTRTKGALLHKFQRGAAHIALKMRTPIRIIRIKCEPMFLTKDNKWYTTPRGKIHFTVDVGELVEVEPLLQQSLSAPLAARELTKQLQEKFERN